MRSNKKEQQKDEGIKMGMITPNTQLQYLKHICMWRRKEGTGRVKHKLQTQGDQNYATRLQLIILKSPSQTPCP